MTPISTEATSSTGDPSLWNRYVYVGNDPVNFVDPSGLKGGWWNTTKCFASHVLGLGGEAGSAYQGDPAGVTTLFGLGSIIYRDSWPLYMVGVPLAAGGIWVGAALIAVGLAIEINSAIDDCL